MSPGNRIVMIRVRLGRLANELNYQADCIHHKVLSPRMMHDKGRSTLPKLPRGYSAGL